MISFILYYFKMYFVISFGILVFFFAGCTIREYLRKRKGIIVDIDKQIEKIIKILGELRISLMLTNAKRAVIFIDKIEHELSNKNYKPLYGFIIILSIVPFLRFTLISTIFSSLAPKE